MAGYGSNLGTPFLITIFSIIATQSLLDFYLIVTYHLTKGNRFSHEVTKNYIMDYILGVNN